jgi:hypothetical protein
LKGAYLGEFEEVVLLSVAVQRKEALCSTYCGKSLIKKQLVF